MILKVLDKEIPLLFMVDEEISLLFMVIIRIINYS